ncbi:MAG TPA: RsmB/NOP family class I SAM-dependent RNA methyltransferase [Nitrososphaera sp.]|nr:RsmB/NOP family class I SAM-dependent RNA methyltransferase [Nitrososphaera sp.]
MLPAGSAESRQIAQEYGYDEWLVTRFLRYVPALPEFLAKMEKLPTQYIRVNTLKTGISELRDRLAAKGFVLGPTVLPEVFSIMSAPMSAGATVEYLLGHYYVQDLSSCLAVHALDARPNQSVLDIAAAPGGKTTMLAQRMDNTGSIVALEPNPARSRSLSFNLARCGVSNTCVVGRDGRDAAMLGGMKFDRVLLDAPCSCEGVIARDATRKTSHAPADVEFCSSRQEQLIVAAAAAVAPGGILVYSTCSFAPEENEAIISSLLQSPGNAAVISVEPAGFGTEGLEQFEGIDFGSEMKNTRRLYPHLHDTTGFFIAKLRFN